MSALDRYFCDPPIRGDSVTLTGTEAHHLIHVMRARPGLRVTLFDGSGTEFVARVDEVRRSEVRLAILSAHTVSRELPLEVTLGVALPKGDRQKWLVEKVVELGLARLVPLQTARSVAQPVAHARERLQRTVIEASKQCRRNRLMEIAEPAAWPEFVRASRDVSRRLLAHPATDAQATAGVARPAMSSASSSVWLAVGPEGGFTDEEVQLALAEGWQGVDLGPRILRVETAAVLLMAMCVT